MCRVVIRVSVSSVSVYFYFYFYFSIFICFSIFDFRARSSCVSGSLRTRKSPVVCEEGRGAVFLFFGGGEGLKVAGPKKKKRFLAQKRQFDNAKIFSQLWFLFIYLFFIFFFFSYFYLVFDIRNYFSP